MRPPESVAESNVAFTVFSALLVLGLMGGALSTGPFESHFKVFLFLALFAGTGMMFLGLNAFHKRRVAETGDARATLYSAVAIWSALSFCVLGLCLALIIFARDFGLLSPDAASRVSYFWITILTLIQLGAGVLCVADKRTRGLLSRRVHLWPWSRYWARRAREGRFHKRYEEGP